MQTDSSTGGYIQQFSGPLEGRDLLHIIHDLIAGVTGLPNGFVRPEYQMNPPELPDHEVDWCSFHIENSEPDYSNSADIQDEEKNTSVKHELLDVLASFYGPSCLDYAGRLDAGMELSQNREDLFKNGMAYRECSDIVHISELINARWYERADITLTLTRECVRTWPIKTIKEIQGGIVSDDPNKLNASFDVKEN